MRPIIQYDSEPEFSSPEEDAGPLLYSDGVSEEEQNIRIYIHENSEDEVSEEEECVDTSDTYQQYQGSTGDEMEVESEDHRPTEYSETPHFWTPNEHGEQFTNEHGEQFILSSRSRFHNLNQFLTPTPEGDNRTAALEKNGFQKTHDPVVMHFLNNPPRFEKNLAYNSLSYLSPGRTFKGTQNQITENFCLEAPDQDKWEVKVTIHSLDQATGTIVGLMEALNVPVASSTVLTYWEGEIVDFVNHHLWTQKWGATEEVDMEHWSRFDAFNKLQDYLPDSQLYSMVYEKYIFMRWKEKFFVNILAHESGLTIAGFYYICIRRSDGFIEGFYYDPTSKPFQRLALYPLPEGNGYGFSNYTFA